MGHSRSAIFEKWYQDHKISVDVQAAFLEESSRPELMASLARQCLRLDPDLPRHLTKKQKSEAYATLKIRKIQQEFDNLGLHLINTWGSVVEGYKHDPTKKEARDQLQSKLRSAKITAERELLQRLKDSFHSEADLHAMIEQLQGKAATKEFLLKPDYALSERGLLAQSLLLESIDDVAFAMIVEQMILLSTRREERREGRILRKNELHEPEFDDMEQPIKEVRAKSPELMRAFPATQVHSTAANASQALMLPSTVPPRSKAVSVAVQANFPHDVPGQPTTRQGKRTLRQKEKTKKSTARRRVCLFCQGKSDSPREYATVASLTRHYREQHLPYCTGEFYCPVKACGKLVRDPDAFARHASDDHKSDIGKRASLIESRVPRKPPQQIVIFE